MQGRERGGRHVQHAITTAWQPGLQDENTFASEASYLDYLSKISVLPAGFRVGSALLTFISPEVPDLGELPMNLTLIAGEEPTPAFAAVFTKNAFPGAPVLVGRERLKSGAPMQAVVINNKVSNVFPSDGGVMSSEAVCSAVADALDLPGGAGSVLPSSTGVIGWRLPKDELCAAVPSVVEALQSESVLPAAKSIMTTDRYPKVSSAELPGGGRIVGIAKGAGMIEPNMATMLCYLLTDVTPPGDGREPLQASLAGAVSQSFNAISVDGDESTSDTVALLSSAKKPAPSAEAWDQALEAVCQDLAAQVVRNGEGTQHVIRVAVSHAPSDEVARRVAKAIVNGPLFKCAVAGNDPNVGRLVGKVGQNLSTELGSLAEGAICRIGGETIFANATFMLDGEKEKRLADHLKSAMMDASLPYPEHGRVVDVEVILGGEGTGQAVVLGSDLTQEYVAVNSDYRS